VDLGGGRRQPQDAIDPHVGIVLAKEVGDAVAAGETLAWVHAGNEAAAATALAQVQAAMRVGPARHRRRPLVLAAPS
jgi:thymidine phosphorylase